MSRSDDLIHILLIEDEQFDVSRVRKTLEPYDAKIRIEDVVSNGAAALELMRTHSGRYDVVIMDYQISGGIFGEELIRKIRKCDPSLQVMVITKMTINQTDVYFANQLMESGAFWFGTKYPGDVEDFIYQPTDFVLTIMNAYERRKLEQSQQRTRRKLDKKIEVIRDQMPALIGESDVMKDLRELISKYAGPEANVFIFGESGTGKELIAANLHYGSRRRYDNFVPVNCAAIPKTLIESELFGFEKGSFTGADRSKPGFFEQADGGTLFLDEITELPMPAQATLLRVLQNGEIDKIGRRNRQHVNVRVIAATNRNPMEAVRSGSFREDLFYRLNILQIHVPPLRKRDGDPSILVRHFTRRFCAEMKMPEAEYTPAALAVLNDFHWPGNVRQLKNVVQRMVILSDGEKITEPVARLGLGQFADTESGGGFSFGDFKSDRIYSLREMDRIFRKKYIRFVRERCSTDMEAAEKLGMAPSNYHRLCKELGLK